MTAQTLRLLSQAVAVEKQAAEADDLERVTVGVSPTRKSAEIEWLVTGRESKGGERTAVARLPDWITGHAFAWLHTRAGVHLAGRVDL